MSHANRHPIPAKRIYTMRFTEEQWEMLQDGINEERNARERVCWVCHGNGHNCPECSGWETDESEEDEGEEE